MSLDELIRSATSRAGVVRVKNALNPILWLCAVSSPLCFGFAYAFNNDSVLHYGLAALGASPIIAGLVAYLYFMLRHPDRLQSEELVLRQQELTIIERKQGAPLPLHANMTEGKRIAGRSQPRTSQEEQP